MSGVVVSVSARKFSVPFHCACCGKPNPEGELDASHTRRTGVRVIRETTRGIAFPYCYGCLHHVGLWNSAENFAIGFSLLGIVMGIAGGAATSSVGVGFSLFTAFFIFGMVLGAKRRSQARAHCGSSCACADTAVGYLGWSGSVSSFRFVSEGYATRFAQGNSRGLINVDADLRRLLQPAPLYVQPQRSQLPVNIVPQQPFVPYPVPAQPVSSKDLLLDWISRIEGLKGTVARRNAVERALSEISDPAARNELLLAASRIEVASVLDKVDGLKSAAAKRRHLEKAIADLHADNIPDELQAEELRQLQSRLSTLAA